MTKFGLIILLIFLASVFEKSAVAYTIEDNVKGSVNFSFNLYRSIFDKSVSQVISPYSLRILLSLLYQTANDTSETELREKINFGEKESTKAGQISVMKSYKSNPTLKLANKMYLSDTKKIRSDFKELAHLYQSEVDKIDYTDSTKAAGVMNKWVEENTNGLIKELIHPDSLDENTTLFVLNALYFKAKWEIPLSKDSVFTSLFFGDDGRYQIKFMVEDNQYYYTRSEVTEVEVIQIPYQIDSNLVFWIILPFPNSNLDTLKEKLNFNLVKTLKSELQEQRIDLKMPIFTIETEINGKEALTNMGLKHIFKEGNLWILDGFDDYGDPVKSLKVDEIKQKSKITVNTEGTEAASATYVKLVLTSLPPDVFVNRPFFYMILTADTNDPIFVGHFAKP